jgi:uroporphyrinogen-III synthase
MPPPSFSNLRVLILESRRAREMASLVSTYGGTPVVAPSMREVPLESNTEALEFADRLMRGEIDMVILLTGVGTRALVDLVDRVRGRRDEFIAALSRVRVVVRGPKPMSVMRELNVPVWLSAPEPNTWREILAALDGKAGDVPLRGLRLAVQEYGVSNPELLAGLEERGAAVTRVPVYQWALPEDIGPLQDGVRALANREIDVVMFTTTTQVTHLMQVAGSMHLQDVVRGALDRVVIASIGPTTSEGLRELGVQPDMEPSHPKMGFLVREAAERASELLARKQQPPGDRVSSPP